MDKKYFITDILYNNHGKIACNKFTMLYGIVHLIEDGEGYTLDDLISIHNKIHLNREIVEMLHKYKQSLRSDKIKILLNADEKFCFI